MSTSDRFKQFCANLVVPDQAQISDRYRRLTKRLNRDFWSTESEVDHSLYVGSYGRNTRISDHSDVDIAFEMPAQVFRQYGAYRSNGQSALLQAVRLSIAQTYPSTRVGADGQVVVVPFSTGVQFEMLPVCRTSEGDYLYPDSNDGGHWRKTNPRAEIKAMRSRNEACKGNLVRLCRMMRAWKIKHGVPITSFLIDTIAYQFIEDWPHRSKSFQYYDQLCRDFFCCLATRDPQQGFWRAPGSGQAVKRTGAFERKAAIALELAKKVMRHDYFIQTYAGRQTWREIFGGYFPG